MAYASERGQAFIDRELYLPEEWAKDKRRRERVGVPEEIEMRTKPDELAREMLGRALSEWRCGGRVGGNRLRLWRRQAPRDVPRREGAALRVLAHSSGKAHDVWVDFSQHRVSEVLDALRQGDSALLQEVAGGGWRLWAGNGSKGPRLYDAFLAAPSGRQAGRSNRRKRGSEKAPATSRSSRESEGSRGADGLRDPRSIVPTLCGKTTAPSWEYVLSWSLWRCHHQAMAKRCHYKHRGVLLA